VSNEDRILSDLADQGDGSVAVPLHHKEGALVCAALNGNHIIGTPLFIHGDTKRAATMQEIHDARLDRGVIDRDREC
jgi:hypothetical protein